MREIKPYWSFGLKGITRKDLGEKRKESDVAGQQRTICVANFLGMLTTRGTLKKTVSNYAVQETSISLNSAAVPPL